MLLKQTQLGALRRFVTQQVFDPVVLAEHRAAIAQHLPQVQCEDAMPMDDAVS